MTYKPAQIKKALVAALGFLLTVIAAALEGHLIPDAWLPYVQAVIGIAAAYGVFAVRNVSRKAVAYSSEDLPPTV